MTQPRLTNKKILQSHVAFPESLGKRIASLRMQAGYTQQALAKRIAISRVAVSHIEMDMTVPSERTITLLAGLFKLTPYEVVEGTSYPRAKAEKLPEVACAYTHLEVEYAILQNDLEWLEHFDRCKEKEKILEDIYFKWSRILDKRTSETSDSREREIIQIARNKLNSLREG